MTSPSISKNPFGRTGPPVTVVGLGGEGVLRTHGRGEEAATVIEEAFAAGITYFESARAYAGSEGYYGLVWPKHYSGQGEAVSDQQISHEGQKWRSFRSPRHTHQHAPGISGSLADPRREDGR